MNHSANSQPPVTPARAARALILAVAAETAIVVAHFAHGARVYDDPYRLHVVEPALVAFVVTLALTALSVWRPYKVTIVALATLVSVLFVGMFGLFHGGYSHVLKDVFFVAGASTDTLETYFMNPDYAYPDNVVFEAGGILTLVAAAFVANRLTRFVRTAWAAPLPHRSRVAGGRT